MESGRGTRGSGPGFPGRLSHPLIKKMSNANTEMSTARFILILFRDAPAIQDQDEPATVLRASVLRVRTSPQLFRRRVRSQLATPRTTTSLRANQRTD